MRIVTSIDNQVTKIVKKEKTAWDVDVAVMNMMPDHMDGFKHLLDTVGSSGMNRLCTEYSGFYRFAKMIERVAQGCRDGLLDDIIK